MKDQKPISVALAIPMTVLLITPLIGTALMRISSVIGKTVVGIASALGIWYANINL